MNSSIVTPGTSELSSTSTYTVLQPMSEESVSLGSVYKSSSSWRKFVSTSTPQLEFESAMTVIPAARTAIEGPTILKPAPLPEDYDPRKDSFFRFLDSLESGAYIADDITVEQ